MNLKNSLPALSGIFALALTCLVAGTAAHAQFLFTSAEEDAQYSKADACIKTSLRAMQPATETVTVGNHKGTITEYGEYEVMPGEMMAAKESCRHEGEPSFFKDKRTTTLGSYYRHDWHSSEVSPKR